MLAATPVWQEAQGFGRALRREQFAKLIDLRERIGAMIVLVTGGLFFDLPLPLAVIGHEGGTVLVVLNGLRLLASPMRAN